MNNPNPNPFVPQGSLLDQKNKLRSRVRTAFLCVVGIPAAVILVALLAQGCKREQPVPSEPPQPPPMELTNPPSMDTNPPVAPTNPAPPVVEPPPPPPAPPAPAMGEYTVVKGDTFSGIAKKSGVSVKAIKEANPGVDPLKLKVGQKLVLPASAAPAATAPSATTAAPVGAASNEQVYTVKSGDTLTKIATHLGTTVKAIRAANSLKTDKIKVGDKLKVPAKASASAAAAAPVAEPAPPAPVSVPSAVPPVVPPAAPPAR